MASRDLTNAFLERRATALKRRGPGMDSNGARQRLTAGGSDEGHSLSLMEVSDSLSSSMNAIEHCILTTIN